MKKRVLAFAAAVLSAVIMFTTVIGCSHVSPSSVAIKFVKASNVMDVDEIMDCFYFPTDEMAITLEAFLTIMDLEMSLMFTDYSITYDSIFYETDALLSDSELDALSYAYGVDVLDGEYGTVYFSGWANATYTEYGRIQSGSSEYSVSDYDESYLNLVTVNIDGSWYVDLFTIGVS